ncbi:hypothetical protein [Arsenicibacter rosenii]|uniref:Uncharacterized protein n=1 Tax=Arsenicibacter rosenii TaxID=1750698 RepID=A0A1S2VNS5_9BACT|nr:hypothetical protein [Arsenicibacter rosenii]OIN59438.1 hypothetical protein BLX24_10735 [Arsenicibacter rosenii]
MAKRLLSLGLLTLLLYHALGTVLISFGTWWQEEHDLSERLTVYRSVDSLVEFQIPLSGQSAHEGILEATEEGFTYRGHYYDVVSMEIKGNTLFIAGLENRNTSFWQRDLLSFMKDTLNTPSETSRKAGQWAKLLLKEYSPNTRTILHFFLYDWCDSVRIPVATLRFTTRSLSILSPPPRFA